MRNSHGLIDHFYFFESAEEPKLSGNVAVAGLPMQSVCPVFPQFPHIAIDSDCNFGPASSIYLEADRRLDNFACKVWQKICAEQYALSNLLADSHLHLRDDTLLAFHNISQLIWCGWLIWAIHFC
jgi:hypothetical protein